MSLESRVVRASHYDEERIVNEYSCFGWELVSNQDVHQEEAGIEYYDLQPWLVTHTTNYVKLTFQRDKGHPHYDELRELEQIYQVNMKAYANSTRIKFGVGRGIFCALLILVSIMQMKENILSGVLFLGASIVIVGIRVLKIISEHDTANCVHKRAKEVKARAQKIL